MLIRSLHLLIAVCAIAGAARAADDPFVGKWKLDSAQSQLPSDTMKVESAGANQYTFIFAEPNRETIAIDGTDQPGLGGTTLSVTVQGPHEWKVVRKSNGRVLLTGIWTLSDDGGTLHDAYTEYGADGSPVTINYLYVRKAGDSGFAGTWESTSQVFESPYEIQIQPYQGDGLSLTDPIRGITQSVRLDGDDYTVAGPNAKPDMKCSGRRISDRHVEVTEKRKGEIRSVNDLELSPDLKTLTETQHRANRPKPVILVFEREE